jgi:malate permease and related proteins
MPAQLLTLFINVLVPVALLVLAGYVAGPRLGLDARTLSRTAYFVLIPAFTFSVLSTANVTGAVASRVIGYAVVVHLGCTLLALIIARLTRRSPEMTTAYVLVAVFGNVGNFGIPIVQFRYPADQVATELGTVYFLAISTLAFAVSVAAAGWQRGGIGSALLSVLKTPALLALPPALLVNWLGIELPPVVARPLGLLATAMIPVMLVALGVTLAGVGLPKLTLDLPLSNIARLLGGPLIALALAPLFGLTGLERSIGVLQASMPAAVLASIIATEYDVLPGFVIASVFFSTVASLLTLTLVLAFVS